MTREKEGYETLRFWYLAKLRKTAHDAIFARSLTPVSLIAADRSVIERLISEKAAEQRFAGATSKKPRLWIGPAVWIGSVVIPLCLAPVIEHLSVSAVLGTWLNLTFGVFNGSGPYPRILSSNCLMPLVASICFYLVPFCWQILALAVPARGQGRSPK